MRDLFVSIFEGLFIEKIDARNGTERILCCTKQICAFGRFFEKLTRCGTKGRKSDPLRHRSRVVV